jgi:hypothetical protein
MQGFWKAKLVGRCVARREGFFGCFVYQSILMSAKDLLFGLEPVFER